MAERILTELYYNSNSTCTNCSAAGNGTGIDVGGVDPADYFYDKTNAPLSSWDFENTWQENAGGYPTLRQ